MAFKAKKPAVLAVALVAVCGLALLQSRFCLCLTVGSSMLPTFKTGDLLIVDKKAYSRTEPRREDIVIARFRHDLVVKRIVALPGEEVEITAGALFVNGILIPESYVGETQRDFNIGKGKMFAGRFATLGDNRAIPAHQTVHPIVSKDQIIGRVLLSISLWPF